MANAAELAPMIRPGDAVIVHDPQPAAMIPALLARGGGKLSLDRMLKIP